MRQVVLASRNRAKLDELTRMLAGQFEVYGAEAFAQLPDIPETGATFAANATLKAVAVARYTGMIAVADDSGLCVDALAGMPGIRSARWAGGHGDDEANLRLVLDQLADVPARDRGARFHCAAVAAWLRGDEVELVVRSGELRGHLLTAPRGSGGFGYDPIFVPAGDTRTTAELTAAEKDAISHRGKAMRALAAALRAGPA